MTTSFTGAIKLSLQGSLTSSIDLGNLSQSVNYNKSYSFTDGTGADQANMIWLDTRTLTASSSEDLDLAGGLTNAFGTTLTFTKIKGLMIVASSSNTNNVLVGGDAAGISTWVGNVNDLVVVRPGGTFCLVASDSTAYAVTGTTADILQIANSAGSSSVTYDIIVIGCV